VALKTAVPVVVDRTVKVTVPDALEAPDAAEIVSTAPRLEARVTVLPATGLPLASCKLTVMVEVVEPSAGIEFGAAATVEVPAFTGPAGAVTLTLSMINWALLEEELPVISMTGLVFVAVTDHVRVVKVVVLAVRAWFCPPKLKLPVTELFWREATSMLRL
jgi:hypothetical protein